MVLVLNKQDLVPLPALERWTSWFQQTFPAIAAVVAVQSASSPDAAAETILAAVLHCVVARDGRRYRVSSLLSGASPREILTQSKLRNLHSKKARDKILRMERAFPQHQPRHEREEEDVPASKKVRDPVISRSSDEYEGEWDTKGTKARKKAHLKEKRQHRMHQHVEHAGQDGHNDRGKESDDEGETAGRQSGQQRWPKRGAKADTRPQQRPAADDSRGPMEESEQEQQEAPTASESSDSENENATFEGLEGVTGMAGTWGGTGEDELASEPPPQSFRPVVVCMVGEPNVGRPHPLRAATCPHLHPFDRHAPLYTPAFRFDSSRQVDYIQCGPGGASRCYLLPSGADQALPDILPQPPADGMRLPRPRLPQAGCGDAGPGPLRLLPDRQDPGPVCSASVPCRAAPPAAAPGAGAQPGTGGGGAENAPPGIRRRPGMVALAALRVPGGQAWLAQQAWPT